jgi:uncharacterized protein (TIGR03067 family)
MHRTLVLTAAVLAVAPAATDDANKKELEALQGTWDEQSIKSNGREEVVRPFTGRLIIAGNRLTYIIHPGEFQATFKIDATRRPVAIDAIGKEWGLVGIYQVNGDTLKICYDPGQKTRPKEFDAKKGDPYVL